MTQSKRVTFLKGVSRLEKKQYARLSNDPLYPGRPSFGGKIRLVTRDALLRDKGGSTPRRNLDIYYDLFTDQQVYADWDKQATEIISKKWFVIPGGPTDEDKAAADLAREALENLGSDIDFGVYIAQDKPCSGFDNLTRGLLAATIAGIGVGEIIWKYNSKGKYIPVEIPVRDARRFIFQYDPETDTIYPKLLTTGDYSDGILLPARKFIFHRHYSIPGFNDSYGFGLGRQLFYPVEWKKEIIIMWLNLVDKYIDPVTVGTHPEDADKEDVIDFKNAIQTIAQEMSITLPEGWELDFLRADIQSSYMALERLLGYIDKKISKIILGEATTGEPSGGSEARETINNSIRLQKAKAWADELSETLNCTLMKWIAELNFADAKPPKIFREFKSDADLVEFVDLVSRLSAAGYIVDPDFIEARTGFPRAKGAPQPDGTVLQAPENPLADIEALGL